MSTRVLTFWHYYDIVCAYSHMGGVSTNKIYHLRVIAPKKGGGSLEMRTLISILVIVAFSLLCSSAVVANRPAMQKALEGFIPNSSSDPNACGTPSTNRLDIPIPIALGSFAQKMRIFPVVTIVDGDQKDLVRGQAALQAELMKVAGRCNFTVSTGVTPPIGTATFNLTLIKDKGQNGSAVYRADAEECGDINERHGNGYISTTASHYAESGEATYVATSASGGLFFNEADGSKTTLSFVDDIFSANEERTKSCYQSGAAHVYANLSRKWGESVHKTVSNSGTCYTGDADYSRSMSSRVTIAEAVETAVYCVLVQVIPFKETSVAGTTTTTPNVEAPVAPANNASTVIAVEDVDPR